MYLCWLRVRLQRTLNAIIACLQNDFPSRDVCPAPRTREDAPRKCGGERECTEGKNGKKNKAGAQSGATREKVTEQTLDYDMNTISRLAKRYSISLHFTVCIFRRRNLTIIKIEWLSANSMANASRRRAERRRAFSKPSI